MKTLATAVVVGALTFAVVGCGTADEAAAPSSSTSTTAAPQPTPLGQVRVGDCVLNTELAAGSMQGVSTLTVVDCDTPDSAPVLAAGPFRTEIRRGGGATTPGIPYPAFPNMYFIAVDECSRLQGVTNPQKTLNFAYPNTATWEAGDHVVVCVDANRATGTFQW